MLILLVAALFVPSFLLLPWTETWTGSAPTEDEAPFVLRTADGDEQVARLSISTANPVTRVEVGDELRIERLDGSDAPLEAEVVLLACPDRPRLAASTIRPRKAWTVPRLADDAYALTVSGDGLHGAFGLVVGDGPVREDRCYR